MVHLSREIRFALLPPEVGYSCSVGNSWSGWPATHLAVPQLKLRAVIAGQPDAVTGYVCNVVVLDRLLRDVVTKILIPEFGGRPAAGEAILRRTVDQVQAAWELPDRLVQIELAMSDTISYTIKTEATDMVHLTQQFEFSAAHRLHCDSLSDQQNRDTFGKCNNPQGHGHNYVVEVSVAGPMGFGGTVVDLDKFHRVVNDEVIDRLDHKHLNRDVPYFADVNPSVENISIAIYRWLEGKIDGSLESVKVFETPKTWAEFRG
jgi:6-pyruvoyltetrahydropterin/6-carboxytetrahydropterin synthase